MLTLNLPEDECLSSDGKAFISAVRQSLTTLVRRWLCRNGGHDFLIWVLEKRRWEHLHLFIYLPPEHERRIRFAAMLFDRLGCRPLPGQTALQSLFHRSSGLPANASPICGYKSFCRTGETGADGAVAYGKKDLIKTAASHVRPVLGKLAGCSESLSREHRKHSIIRT